MSAPRPSSQGSNWYPTRDQLDSPEKMMAAMKQVLDQHYALQDQVARMPGKEKKGSGKLAPASASPTSGSAASPPPGSGPIDSMILGLRVQPVAPNSLADGTVLTYVKASGNFQFK